MEPTQTPPSPQTEVPVAPATEVVQSKPSLSIPVAIIIAGVLIAGAILLTSQLGGTKTVNPYKDMVTAGEPYIGKASAPTVTYFSDYQCPFCKKFETQNLPTLKKDYVDTGKVKIVFKDFVFLGPDSTTAALFGRAVWSLYPDQYFAWREAMYQAQDAEGNVGFGNRVSIEALTKQIPGIDQAKVSAAVDAHTADYQKLINDDYAEGQKFGVQGTPSVIIGASLIDGAYPLASYTSALASIVK
jgi:protein-disulfide isomerase